MTNPTDQQQRYIEIWAKAVDTQMHFNEMSVKSRQLGLTFVAAALGLAVVLLSQGEDFALSIPTTSPVVLIHISVVLTLGALLALYAVRTLDLSVYHKMLRGAVTFGEDFEEHYMKQIFDLEKGMTQAISHFSRYEDAKKDTNPETKKYKYTGENKISAEDKILAFYKNTFRFLIGSAITLFILSNINIWIALGSRFLSEAQETPNVSASSVHPPADNDNASK